MIQRAQRQRGATLVVALILLLAMGMLAAWAARSATNNLRVVGNTQARQEVFDAAQTAIESTISSPAFSQNPTLVASQPISVDLDGDGRPDMTARVSPAPTCYRWRTVKSSELDATVAADRNCLGSVGGNPGLEGGSTSSGDSLCADSEWNVRATVSDANTGATTSVNQGIAMRGLVTDVVNACP